MPHRVPDRVEDTFTTTGTGNITVAAAAPAGKLNLSEALTVDGDTGDFILAHTTADEFEFSRLTRVSANVYSRAVWSSTTGSLINFAAGTKEVFSDFGAFFAKHLNMVEITIASVAGATDIGALQGKFVTITGTNTMTGFGTIANQERFVRYQAATPHTHNGTSFICRGGASFTSEAGDTAIWKSDSSGNWRCWHYQRANGDQEGLWTPTLTFVTPGDLSVVYANRLGTYKKVGRIVVLTCRIQTSTFTHTTASGSVRITGLPFTAAATERACGVMELQGITLASYTQFIAAVEAGATAILVVASGSGVGSAFVTASNMPTGGTVVLAPTVTHFT